MLRACQIYICARITNSKIYLLRKEKMHTLKESISQGLTFFQAGELALASNHFRGLLEDHPNHPDVAHLLGLVSYHQGEFGDALEQLRQAIELSPETAKYHYDLGNLYCAQKEYKNAINAYKKAVSLSPSDMHMHLSLANTYYEQGEVLNALSQYLKITQIDPFYPDVYCQLGKIYIELNEHHIAVELFRQAVSLKVGYLDASVYLGKSYWALGDTINARICLEECYQRAPNHPEVAALYAQIELLNKNFELGWQAYQKSVPEQPVWNGKSIKKDNYLFIWSENDLNKLFLFSHLIGTVENVEKEQVCFVGNTQECDFIQMIYPDIKIFDMDKENTYINHAKSAVHTSMGLLPKYCNQWKQDKGQPLFKINDQLLHKYREGYLHHTKNHPVVGCYFGPLADADSPSLLQWEQFVQDKPMIVFENVDYGQLEAMIHQVKALDLLITVDAPLAHVAAHCGVPVYLLVNHHPSWYWFLNAESTQWYDNVTLFRQEAAGTWDRTFETLNTHLRDIQ